MKTAIYPGSFDPVTFGHIDIIKRAASLFDKVIVLVSINPVKEADFSAEERMDFIRRSIKLKNVEIDCNVGLFIDYFRKRNADVIVKGIRAMSDFEYEFQMALINKDLCHTAETVFLSADAASMFLSSSAVKQIAMFGGDISAFVPNCILKDILERMKIK
ncbi:MAG: pantetheine-phosphate adenylyltransferase [Oscillospiraceae bacterium]|nr:pantetheine-phosphate adenylyltransferase [Oscillospiraceae bacterium]